MTSPLDGVHVRSDGAGTPAVLVSAGMADAGFSWGPVASRLADRHRVVRFDRPGLGSSAARRDYPSLAGEVDRIAAVIDRLDLGRPVLVAHSAAALPAEAYARRWPAGLSGLVLVDPSVVGRASPRPAPLAAGARRLVRVGAGAARMAGSAGLVRLVGPRAWRLMVRAQTNRPPAHWPLAEGDRMYREGRVVAAALAELVADGELAADLVALRRLTAPPAVPVVIMTALAGPRSAAARSRWRIAHDELARSFPAGRQEVLRDSRHLVQIDDPAAIVAAVASCLPAPAG